MAGHSLSEETQSARLWTLSEASVFLCLWSKLLLMAAVMLRLMDTARMANPRQHSQTADISQDSQTKAGEDTSAAV
jgi:hypothetical protein